MKYIMIGALLAIGWMFVEFICEIIREVILTRIRQAKWYQIICGRAPKNINGRDSKKSKVIIGFYPSEEES